MYAEDELCLSELYNNECCSMLRVCALFLSSSSCSFVDRSQRERERERETKRVIERKKKIYYSILIYKGTTKYKTMIVKLMCKQLLMQSFSFKSRKSDFIDVGRMFRQKVAIKDQGN